MNVMPVTPDGGAGRIGAGGATGAGGNNRGGAAGSGAAASAQAGSTNGGRSGNGGATSLPMSGGVTSADGGIVENGSSSSSCNCMSAGGGKRVPTHWIAIGLALCALTLRRHRKE